MQIAHKGLVPILEPEVDIHCPDKAKAEEIMHGIMQEYVAKLHEGAKIMFKVTIPTVDNLYADLMKDANVVRVVALSGGYSMDDANEKLTRNHGLIASFSRALLEGLDAGQTREEFDAALAASIDSIYRASTT